MVAKKKANTTQPQPSKGWGDGEQPQPQPKEETLWGNAGVHTEAERIAAGNTPVENDGSGTYTTQEAADRADGATATTQPAPAEPEQPKAKAKGRGRAAKVRSDGGSLADPDASVNMSNVKRALIAYVERLERNAEEQQALKDDAKEIVAEIKAEGYNVPILREVLRRRKKGADAMREHDSLLEIYEEALR